MKIYIYYTQTHKDLMDKFLIPTLSVDNKLQPQIVELEQKCQTGFYMTDGFVATMIDRTELMLELCETEQEPFIHCDSDVQFFNPVCDDIHEQLKIHNCDILAQDDAEGGHCCGFMVVVPSKKTCDMFKQAIMHMKKHNVHDQVAINFLIPRLNVAAVALDETYFSIWRSTNHQPWNPNMKLRNIPHDIRIHHANWTGGVQWKEQMMQQVRDYVDQNNK